MGRHATRLVEVDEACSAASASSICSPSSDRRIRAGVESYSIKVLEPFYGFTRHVELGHAGRPAAAGRRGARSGRSGGARRDVCATSKAITRTTAVRRSSSAPGSSACATPSRQRCRGGASGGQGRRAPPPQVKERQVRIDALRQQLLGRRADAPVPIAEALRLLAYLIDWHYREDKVAWWEFFRLRDLPDEDLFDERSAVTGLEFVERLGPSISARPASRRSRCSTAIGIRRRSARSGRRRSSHALRTLRHRRRRRSARADYRHQDDADRALPDVGLRSRSRAG